MSSSDTVGLMTLCRVTCCPCAAAPSVLAPAKVIPSPNAVATTMPATNAPAIPAATVTLHFIIFLLSQHSTTTDKHCTRLESHRDLSTDGAFDYRSYTPPS